MSFAIDEVVGSLEPKIDEVITKRRAALLSDLRFVFRTASEHGNSDE
jgi:hypothetical protein